MEDVWYRVFYDHNNEYWYTEKFPTIEEARNAAHFRKEHCGNTNVRIVEEVTTRRTVEIA
jgi:hypothetical protein